MKERVFLSNNQDGIIENYWMMHFLNVTDVLTNRVNCSGSTFNLTLFWRVVRDLRALFFNVYKTILTFWKYYSYVELYVEKYARVTSPLCMYFKYMTDKCHAWKVENAINRSGKSLVNSHPWITQWRHLSVLPTSWLSLLLYM